MLRDETLLCFLLRGMTINESNTNHDDKCYIKGGRQHNATIFVTYMIRYFHFNQADEADHNKSP